MQGVWLSSIVIASHILNKVRAQGVHSHDTGACVAEARAQPRVQEFPELHNAVCGCIVSIHSLSYRPDTCVDLACNTLRQADATSPFPSRQKHLRAQVGMLPSSSPLCMDRVAQAPALSGNDNKLTHPPGSCRCVPRWASRPPRPE